MGGRPGLPGIAVEATAANGRLSTGGSGCLPIQRLNKDIPHHELYHSSPCITHHKIWHEVLVGCFQSSHWGLCGHILKGKHALIAPASILLAEQGKVCTCSNSWSDPTSLSIMLTSSSDVYGLRSSFRLTGVDSLRSRRGFLGGVACKKVSDFRF